MGGDLTESITPIELILDIHETPIIYYNNRLKNKSTEDLTSIFYITLYLHRNIM